MSDCYINIRFGLYHFKLTRSWRIRIERNDFHMGYPFGFFAVYEFKPFR